MSDDAANVRTSASAANDAARAAIRSIWNAHRESTMERLDVLDRAITELMTDTLEEEARLEAERAAHTLAGAVGTFGFMRASENAREIELTLRTTDGLGPDRASALSELVRATRRELDEEPFGEKSFRGPGSQ